ncbi:MAG: ISAzo13 family transposase, partial [Rhodopirellula sp.]|nr:ISAzo13 family transposase [Rhodopirellula sp.]
CWSALERKWSGVLLNGVSFVLDCARRMIWKGQCPPVHQLPERDYPTGVKLSRTEMSPWEARLHRKPGLEKYDITITPRTSTPAV